MGSIMYAVECPCCGRSAFEDYYYKTEEKSVICFRCGYYYSKKIERYNNNNPQFTEDISEGHGIFVLAKKDGRRERRIWDSPLTDAQLAGFMEKLNDEHVNQEESYIVSYENGEFSILYGTPTENFHLPFEEYREKMNAKYGEDEFDFMVAIEE